MIYVLRQWKNGNINGICSHLERHSVPYRVVEAWDVEALPPIRRGDAVLALGGPPSVCRFREPDYDVHFLLREAAWLDQCRALRIPVMGICLGHQLIAAMRGQRVATGSLVFGFEPVDTTLHGRDHWLFAGVPERLWVYQHHRDAVQEVTPGAQVLASSETCAIESVAWDETTVSTQFHPEVLRGEVRAVIEKYAEYLGGRTVDDVLARVPADYQATTSRIFDNFLYRAGAIERPTWVQRTWSIPVRSGEVSAA
jgi:GMP synthase-like glutamine amidotransferase